MAARAETLISPAPSGLVGSVGSIRLYVVLALGSFSSNASVTGSGVVAMCKSTGAKAL